MGRVASWVLAGTAVQNLGKKSIIITIHQKIYSGPFGHCYIVVDVGDGDVGDGDGGDDDGGDGDGGDDDGGDGNVGDGDGDEGDGESGDQV